MKVLLFGKIREDYQKSYIELNDYDKNDNLTFFELINILNNKYINLNNYNNIMFSLNHEYINKENMNSIIMNKNDIIGIIPPINAG